MTRRVQRQANLGIQRVTLREVRTTLHVIAEPPRDVNGENAPAIQPWTAAELVRRQFALATDPQENLVALYLDSRCRVIAAECVFRGTINGAHVSTRDIARGALLSNACAVVIAHNHPSGDPTPSVEDVTFTHRLDSALGLLGIDLEDHIIIAGANHRSLRDAGILS